MPQLSCQGRSWSCLFRLPLTSRRESNQVNPIKLRAGFLRVDSMTRLRLSCAIGCIEHHSLDAEGVQGADRRPLCQFLRFFSLPYCIGAVLPERFVHGLAFEYREGLVIVFDRISAISFILALQYVVILGIEEIPWDDAVDRIKFLDLLIGFIRFCFGFFVGSLRVFLGGFGYECVIGGGDSSRVSSIRDHVCSENDVVVGDGQAPVDLLNLFMGGFSAFALQIFDHCL